MIYPVIAVPAICAKSGHGEIKYQQNYQNDHKLHKCHLLAASTQST